MYLSSIPGPHDPLRRVGVAAALCATMLLGWQTPAVAQDALSVPKFPIPGSPLTISGDVRPHQYLGVIGRAAAWLGRETGPAEIWVHPLKIASDFQLDFRIPDYVEPIRGVDVARTVEIRPAVTTITYSHATFTVRQHILAPLDEPGLLVLLDVETFRRLDVIVSFKTVFQYAWPAAFGGQYAFWNADAAAFVLSESLRERNAMIGSPWARTASSHPAHALPEAPNTFVVPVDIARAASEFIPIAIVAATAPRDSVERRYRSLITDARRLVEARSAHSAELIERATSIETPDAELNAAFAWSTLNLDESLSCNPDLGCGLVAGWGPSGQGTRPGFGWYFGGDAAINSLAMDAVGLWTPVERGLRFLASYQRDDGKIPHEISQAAARIPWFTDFPYTYYHADTTPYWIVAVWRYWLASGDDRLLEDLWPAVRRAYEWCLTRDTDRDGIIENGPGNLGAIEVGELGEGIHQDIYLAGVWIEALAAMEALAGTMNDRRLADDAAQLRRRASARLNDAYWRDAEGHHAFGILQSGGTNDNLTVWPATAAAFGLLDGPRAERTLTKLAADSISTDWGARILSSGSALYDPMHYNNGAVWPFVTGFVAWGQYNYRRPWSGYPLVDALAQMTWDWARGRHPELLSGRFYRPLDTAVPHQFFATSMLVSPIMYGLLGWQPAARERRAELAPQLPPNWDRTVVRNLAVGSTQLDVAFEQSPEQFSATLSARGAALQVTLRMPVPPGARDVQLVGPVDAMPLDFTIDATPHDQGVVVTLPVSGVPLQVSVTWSGGLTVAPPTVGLVPGQSSRGIRILDFRSTGGGWTLLVEGEAHQEYALRLHGEPVTVTRGPGAVAREGSTQTLTVTLPAGPGRTTTSIELHPSARR